MGIKYIYPGSTNDATIYNESDLERDFNNGTLPPKQNPNDSSAASYDYGLNPVFHTRLGLLGDVIFRGSAHLFKPFITEINNTRRIYNLIQMKARKLIE